MTYKAASAYENLEWINKLVEYTEYVVKQKSHIRLIGMFSSFTSESVSNKTQCPGICFGHQIISRALGCECVPNSGKWEIGPTTLDLTELGKQLFGVETLVRFTALYPIFVTHPLSQNIQQMHRDHVPELPSTCQLLASTSITPNQGFIRYLPNAPPSPSPSDIQIFTVQGHPEFTESIVSSVVDLRESTGVFDKDMAADARRRAQWRNDGVSVIGKLIWRILGVN